MPVNDELGKRMKELYENVPKTRLMRRTPVIIRVDGKAFHTFTKGFAKPFDKCLMQSMQQTMQYLCKNIQGCVLGYTQSDEISLLLVDYKSLDSQAWFDYEVQKVCSISASMATLEFNRKFKEYILEESRILYENLSYDDNDKLGALGSALEKDNTLLKIHQKAIEKGAMFDSRCFNIPKEEVTNYFYWRQLDATRNSIQMVGQANFSHKELQNKSCSMIQDMLHEQKGINWNDFSIPEKRGACCIKIAYTPDGWAGRMPSEDEDPHGIIRRTKWIIDENIPIFKNEGRDYIERLVNCTESL